MNALNVDILDNTAAQTYNMHAWDNKLCNVQPS